MGALIKQVCWLQVYFVLLLVSAIDGRARAEETLSLLAQHNPPYTIFEAVDGRLVFKGGVLYDQLSPVLQNAGIRSVWSLAAPKRIWALMDDLTSQPFCSGYWYDNRERRKKAVYTNMLAPDIGDLGLYVRKAIKDKFTHIDSLEILFTQSNHIYGKGAGLSSGKEIEAAIKQFRPNVLYVPGGNTELVRLLAHGRVDYIVSDTVAINRLLSQNDVFGQIAFIETNYLPASLASYVICSRNTPGRIIDVINATAAEAIP